MIFIPLQPNLSITPSHTHTLTHTRTHTIASLPILHEQFQKFISLASFKPQKYDFLSILFDYSREDISFEVSGGREKVRERLVEDKVSVCDTEKYTGFGGESRLEEFEGSGAVCREGLDAFGRGYLGRHFDFAGFKNDVFVFFSDALAEVCRRFLRVFAVAVSVSVVVVFVVAIGKGNGSRGHSSTTKLKRRARETQGC